MINGEKVTKLLKDIGALKIHIFSNEAAMEAIENNDPNCELFQVPFPNYFVEITWGWGDEDQEFEFAYWDASDDFEQAIITCLMGLYKDTFGSNSHALTESWQQPAMAAKTGLDIGKLAHIISRLRNKNESAADIMFIFFKMDAESKRS